MKNFNSIFVLGDIHGHWSLIINFLDKISETNSCIIQVGDFNVGFDRYDSECKRLKNLNNELIKRDSVLYIVRGNHDNPSWFKDDEFLEIKSELSNIKFVPDYSVININGENFLMIGGAVSIDRTVQRQKSYVSWWEDEILNFDSDKVKNLRNIDRMICHISPNFCEPLTMSGVVYEYLKKDGGLLQDLRTERDNITKLVNIVMSNNKLKGFYYGHYHKSFRFYHNDCEFIGLDIDEFKQLN